MSTNKTSVAFLDLKRQYAQIKTEVDAAIARVVTAGDFIMGPDVEAFEREFATYSGVKHCVAVANGTDALVLMLRAMGVIPGQRVVVPVNTFIATSEAVTAVGGLIEFVDVDPVTLLMTPAILERKLIALKEAGTPAVAAMPVHLYGNMCQMAELAKVASKHSVMLLEDAAQAHGAQSGGQPPGTHSEGATFSFYPGKNLGAYGDAGAIVTNKGEIFAAVSSLRNHGRSKGMKYEHAVEGYNSRMDAIQGAVLRVKLRHLDEWTERRRAVAAAYDRALADLPGIQRVEAASVSKHVYHLYVIQVAEREAFRSSLLNQGVATGIHYPIPLHQLDAYRYMKLEPGRFPVTESASSRIVSLPMDGGMDDREIEAVIAAVRKAAAELNG